MKTFVYALMGLACTLTMLNTTGAFGQGGVYFREGFEENNGWPSTAADATPLKAVTTPSNGVFYTFGAYRTNGSTGACATQTGGTSHLRFANLANVAGYSNTDSSTLITPLVNAGIFDMTFLNGRASRRLTIYKTSEADPNTNNWTLVTHFTNNNTACQALTVSVNDANAKRLRIVARAGTDSDIDTLVMTSVGPLPMRMGDIRLQERNRSVQVEWSTYNEQQVKGYSVERSTDGRRFETAGFIPAINAPLADYQFTDFNKVGDQLFYRIKGVDLDGTETISKIAMLRLESKESGSIVVVNPIAGRTMDIQLNGLKPGHYAIAMIGTSGQPILRREADIRTNRVSMSLALPIQIGPGVYLLSVQGEGTRHITKVILE